MGLPKLIVILLLVISMTLAAWLQPLASNWSAGRGQTGNLLAMTLGDARQMFANHFFVKADVYLHSGYYPSIFDQARTNQTHIAEQAAANKSDGSKDEEQESFLGPPRDWIEKFGRNFSVTEHSHLSGKKEDEILPWLRLSAELDPHRVETYTVGAYWLRNKLGKTKEAEQFLREGRRANPDSYEILFQLGQLCEENYHDAALARNIWELALRKWEKKNAENPEPDSLAKEQILSRLALLEEREGNLQKALSWLELLKTLTPHPETIQKQIEDIKARLNSSPRLH